MLSVTLGEDGFSGSKMGLGCMGMSGIYKVQGEEVEDQQVQDVFDKAEQLGVSVLNSATFYGANHHNLRVIGKHIAGRQEKFQVAVKFGLVGDITGGLRPATSAAEVREQCETALQLLGVSTIDLFVQARINPSTPLEETMAALKELRDQGKIKHVGLSEVTPDELRAAHAICPVSVLEQEWSLWSRDIETDLVPTCKELGVGIMAYSPLGRGFLTGALDKEAMQKLDKSDFRVVGQPRLQGEALDANLKLVEVVKRIASSMSVTAGQVAIAWLYKQAEMLGVAMIAIPGTTKVKYLEENVAALAVGLSDADMEMLNSTFDPAAVAGGRYADGHPTYGARTKA